MPDTELPNIVPVLENMIPALGHLQNLVAHTNAEQTDALHKLFPELERMQVARADKQSKETKGLDKFESGTGLKKLEQLSEEQRGEFDALDLVGLLRLETGRALWGSEEFHSGVLAWLLDPGQSHGCSQRFLRPFLLSAGVRSTSVSSDWSTTEVTREWGNLVNGERGYLDILIVNEAEQVLCAIENKVFSSEHSEQLTRYRKALESEFPNFIRHHVFLTPGCTQPSRPEERVYWVSLGYAGVFDIVQSIAEADDNPPNEGVRSFLRQYAITLRRNVMPETSVSQLARRIYLEHHEAVELIVANRPDWVSEGKQVLKEAVGQQRGWILDVEDRDFVRFRSADWDRYEVTHTGSGWAPRSNALLLFQFRFYNGRPWLDLGLSPSDDVNYSFRQKLFDAVRQHPKFFNLRSTSLSESWAILHEGDYILDSSDYGVGWDDGTTRAKLESWVSRFASEEFPLMNEVIVNCLHE